ncbi:MAG: hypothetical protein J6R85_02980, partial [Lentisphaeria bacterium]|nr:hypothetical protein [Lentisphaeria bacterium]
DLPLVEDEPLPPASPVRESVPEPVREPEPRPAAVPQSAAPQAASIPAEAPEMNTHVTVAGQKKHAPIFSSSYKLPLVEMLDKGEESAGEDLESIARNKVKIQNALQNFNIAGQVVGHISGPRLTSYEIRLDPGVPVKKITGLERDFLMALSAMSIRILAPIPGRNVVGLEVPNAHAEAVFMRSILESDAWQNSRAEIPIVLGKNVAGEPTILDLARAPHLLIAGSTGSGKSVCMNTLIMSLLYKFSPEELRLILVDPKVVEMEDYRKLPHLITPVVNDASKVPLALRWADNEMERRYRVLARAGVKKLSDFNTRPLPSAPVLDENGLPIPDKMPLLIIIVDELADLMMTDAKSDVEKSIARIAQKGRAAGIHLVIATQRPSTNIVTGVIKANLPTKIAFRVTSNVDSRVILDKPGAEALLGKGDMLFIPPGSADLERIQGAMVSDSNIKMIVKFVSDQAPQNFDSQVVAEEDIADDEKYAADDYAPAAGYSDRGEGKYDPDEEDEEPGMPNLDPIIRKYLHPGDPPTMYRALEIVFMERKASTSYFQRRLSIGYNSAAELVDKLEQRGVISGPLAGGQKREILVTDALEVNEI